MCLDVSDPVAGQKMGMLLLDLGIPSSLFG